MTIRIDVHGEGATGTNLRSVDATDIGVCEIDSAGGNSANGKHILITGKTRVANVNIVAENFWIGTCVGAQGNVEIGSAILKRRVADRSIAVSVSVCLQRERAHSRIGGAVVVIDQGGCSKAAVSCARRVEQKACGAHCRVGIFIVGYQRSSANGGVEIAGGRDRKSTRLN